MILTRTAVVNVIFNIFYTGIREAMIKSPKQEAGNHNHSKSRLDPCPRKNKIPTTTKKLLIRIQEIKIT